MPIPSHIDDDHAAAFLAGAGYLVGYLVLTEFVAFKPGLSVLAPGIGGAVGMESVQIARKLGASLAISTASTSAKAGEGLRPECKTDQRASCLRNEPIVFYVYVKRDSATTG